METLALGFVGQSKQKNYPGKLNVWVAERKAQGKGPWLQYNPSASSQVLSELLELMGCRCYVHNNQQSIVKVPCRDQVFPQDVRRVRASHVALHDRSRGKRDRPGSRADAKTRAGQVTADLGLFGTREASSHKHGRKGKGPVVGSRAVVFFVMPCL